MIRRPIIIICDRCDLERITGSETGGLSVIQARRYAKTQGWGRARCRGIYRDICPGCLAIVSRHWSRPASPTSQAEVCAGCWAPLHRGRVAVETASGAMHVSCAVAHGRADAPTSQAEGGQA